jgi:hypothetical protein
LERRLAGRGGKFAACRVLGLSLICLKEAADRKEAEIMHILSSV